MIRYICILPLVREIGNIKNMNLRRARRILFYYGMISSYDYDLVTADQSILLGAERSLKLHNLQCYNKILILEMER